MARENLMRVSLGALLVLASLAAPPASWAQDAGTAPPFPPPGRLVDIGGWRLHLNCTGQASATQPTVILEAGIGDFSVEWSLVQPKVAQFARVCSYDRADDGWSDLGPRPRTLHQIVYELHTLLDKAGEPGPYVLVGHSYGGWLVRLYQMSYPSEVAGLVLVEAGADDPVRVLSDGVPRHASDLVTGKPIPPVKTAGPLREADIPPAALSQMQDAARRFGPRANETPRDKLPAEAQRMRSWAYSQVKHWAQADNPVEPEELALLRAERTRSDHSLGELPLTVLTRGVSEEDGPDGKASEEQHRKDHAVIAAMSRKGKLIVATHSGHHVQLDEPDLVVSTIQEVLAAIRK